MDTTLRILAFSKLGVELTRRLDSHDNELNELIPGVVGRILIAAKLGNTRLIDNMPILLKEKS